jgi:signal transduction histidine kinase
MSLFQYIRRYLILTLLVMLLLGCVSIFFIFKVFIHKSTDEALYEYKDRIENYVKLNDTLIIFKTSLQMSQRIESKIIEDADLYSTGIKDTLLYNEITGYFQPYRQLSFTTEYKNKPHLITVNQPTVELDGLFYVIVGSLLSIFSLFIVFTYLIDFYLKRKAWLPFYKTLNVLKEYDLGIGKEFELNDSGINEFDELNHAVQKMVSKINDDYENMKLFSEDISHEMQTPLAIVKSKVEILRQNKSNYEDSLAAINVISKAISRLSKLNTSLLLITKIKNDQYQEISQVNIKQLVEHYLEAFEELIEIKGIKVESELEDNVVTINSTLSDILISNLLSNTIRHNTPNGFIYIKLENGTLIVENACESIDLNMIPNLFDRLICKKSEDSTGLGLSIVKSICDKNNITINYSYPEKNIFRIQLNFNLCP